MDCLVKTRLNEHRHLNLICFLLTLHYSLEIFAQQNNTMAWALFPTWHDEWCFILRFWWHSTFEVLVTLDNQTFLCRRMNKFFSVTARRTKPAFLTFLIGFDWPWLRPVYFDGTFLYPVSLGGETPEKLKWQNWDQRGAGWDVDWPWLSCSASSKNFS